MKYIIGLFLIMAIATTHSQAQQDHSSHAILRHMVLLKFKDDSSPEAIKKVEDAFRELPSKIKEIKSFEWGKNNSPENLNQGFTHCFFVSFQSDKDREVYLPHPAHKAFVEILKPQMDKVLVVDYWTGE
jgi:Stress responsive A/B Barrel Domain